MRTNIGKHLPLGLWLIVSFYVFGALVLVVSLFTNGSNVRQVIAAAHGLSPSADTGFVWAVAALALVLAYGLVSLSRWGFLLALGYSFLLCFVSLARGGLTFAWTGQPELQTYFGNLVWSGIVLIYLLSIRNRFLHPETSEQLSQQG